MNLMPIIGINIDHIIHKFNWKIKEIMKLRLNFFYKCGLFLVSPLVERYQLPLLEISVVKLWRFYESNDCQITFGSYTLGLTQNSYE